MNTNAVGVPEKLLTPKMTIYCKTIPG